MDFTSLLELRQTVRVTYIRYETYIRYALRFVLALVSIGMINGRLGYSARLSGFFVTLLVSLVCAVLPEGFTAFFAAVLILAHLYALSLETCAIAMVLFLCIYLMYFRFAPHDAVVILLVPVLFVLRIPHIMPFVVGLLFTPVSILSMSFGVIIYFFLHGASAGESSGQSGLAAAEESLSRVQDIVGAMVGERTMFIYIVAFALSAALIYVLRRQSFDRSWFVAIGAGALTILLILLLGDVMLDTGASIPFAFLGTLLGMITGAVILFFRFHLDYSRVEQVQFEDEEYYYYVKAVPKIVLNERAPRLRSINRALDTGEKEEAHGTEGAHAAPAGHAHAAREQTHHARSAAAKAQSPHAPAHAQAGTAKNAHAKAQGAKGREGANMPKERTHAAHTGKN